MGGCEVNVGSEWYSCDDGTRYKVQAVKGKKAQVCVKHKGEVDWTDNFVYFKRHHAMPNTAVLHDVKVGDVYWRKNNRHLKSEILSVNYAEIEIKSKPIHTQEGICTWVDVDDFEANHVQFWGT